MTYNSNAFKSDKNIFYREIFSCKLGFDPIYESILPLGVAAFNEKGILAIVETNSLGPSENNKC
jgi:hypothetical protein